jgi:hypothetical protein
MIDRAHGLGEGSEAATAGIAADGLPGLTVEPDQADTVAAMARAVGLAAQSLAAVLPRIRQLGLRGPGYDPAMPPGFEYEVLAGLTVELLAWAKAAGTAADAARRRLIVVRRRLWSGRTDQARR